MAQSWDFRQPFKSLVSGEDVRLAWVSPHVMRKTFASLLVSSGCSYYKVADWLGDDQQPTHGNYAYLLKQDEEIELAFSRKGEKQPAAEEGGPKKAAKRGRSSKKKRTK